MQIVSLLPSQVKKCNRCGQDIAFLQNKAGKWYPVNADYALDGGPATHKTNFHKCGEKKPL